MDRKCNEYHKIMQLLKSSDTKTFKLGIQLLKSTLDPKLIAQVLIEKCRLNNRFAYHLVPIFQANKHLWEYTRNSIPDHIKNEILHWMPYVILELENPSVHSFCVLASKKVKEHFPGLPELNPNIMTEEQRYGAVYYCN